MTDPFSILGITPDATNEQVKSAYRDLARKNHPDNYQKPEDKAKAEERMKRINEAYHAIRAMRTGKRTESAPPPSDPILEQAREAIQTEDFDRAEELLDTIEENKRGGEWNFLRGCVLIGKGWYFDAQKHLQTACYMDPENEEYRDVLRSVKKAGGEGHGYKAHAPGSHSDLCDTCLTLACLDCFCDCFSGDCVKC